MAAEATVNAIASGGAVKPQPLGAFPETLMKPLDPLPDALPAAS